MQIPTEINKQICVIVKEILLSFLQYLTRVLRRSIVQHSIKTRSIFADFGSIRYHWIEIWLACNWNKKELIIAPQMSETQKSIESRESNVIWSNVEWLTDVVPLLGYFKIGACM